MDSLTLLEPATARTLLALLVCGHVLGDFVFQTRQMVDNKNRFKWLGFHIGTVTLSHALLLIPFASWRALVVLTVIASSHAVIDRLKVTVEQRASSGLTSFVVDQILHLLVLVAVWRWWTLIPGGPQPLDAFASNLEILQAGAVLVAAYAFNVMGGATVVSGLLARYDLASAGRSADQPPAMGQAIGILERMILLTLGLMGQWGALGLVLTAKSIARFKDLEDRAFSEYYLIGTLASFIVAVASVLVVRALG